MSNDPRRPRISTGEEPSFGYWLDRLEKHYMQCLGLDYRTANERAAKRLTQCWGLPKDEASECAGRVLALEGLILPGPSQDED